MSQPGYRFRAEPRALAATKRAPTASSNTLTQTIKQQHATPTRYREETKETVTLNIMQDPRVVRGSNFSKTRRRSTHQSSSKTQEQEQAEIYLQDQSGLPTTYQHTLVNTITIDRQDNHDHRHRPTKQTPVFIRPETPVPVEGRVHLSVQTDPVYEDLRIKAHPQLPMATQTDPELDYEAPVLFNPKSSGTDIGTAMESPDGIPDFDRDVAMILDDLCSLSLEAALIEVCQEEEEKEIQLHKQHCQQRMQQELDKVQVLVNHHTKQQQEKERRLKQAEQYKQQRLIEKQQKQAALLLQRQQAEQREAARLAAQAAWINPVKVEVETEFLPWLTQQVQQQLQQHVHSQTHLQTSLMNAWQEIDRERKESAARRKEREFEAYVKARYEGVPVPQPSLETKMEQLDQHNTNLMQHINGQSYTAPPTLDAESAALFLIRQREVKLAAERKYQEDIIRVQSQVRARRDRRRARLLKQRRDLLERRKYMTEKELIQTLGVDMGMILEELTNEEKSQEQQEQSESSGSVVATSREMESSRQIPLEVKVEPPPSPATTTTTSSTSLSLTTLTAPAGPLSSRQTPSASPSAQNTARSFTIAPVPKQGLRVLKVIIGGAANQAGILKQDIVTHINNQAITSLSQYQALLKTFHAGDILTITVYRSITRRTDVLLAECHCNEASEYSIETVRELRTAASLPTHEAPIYTPESAVAELEKIPIKLGFAASKVKSGGVLVNKLAAGTNAAACGLIEGDVIKKVNKQVLESVDEWKELQKDWRAGDCVVLHIQRPTPSASTTTSTATTTTTPRATSPATPLIRVVLEVAGSGKKATLEWVRSLRLIAGLKVAK